MNIKKYLAIFITLLGLSYFTVQEASANTTNPNEDYLLSQVKIYDGDNNLIPYSLEEVKELVRFETNNSPLENNNLVTPFAIQRTYSSGAFDFVNYTYLKDGDSFKNPVDIQITPKGTAKAFTLKVESTKTGVTGTTIDLPGGWTGTVHYSLEDLDPSNYTFRFTNKGVGNNLMQNVHLIYTY